MMPRGPNVWTVFNRAAYVWVHGYAAYVLSMFIIVTVIILVR